jgi:P-type Cu2+ transporter
MKRFAHRHEDHGAMPHANTGHMNPVAHKPINMDHGHAGNGHAAMVADFRNRFWISMILTVPVLALSPLVQDLLGLRERLAFRGESYVLFGFSAVIYLSRE